MIFMVGVLCFVLRIGKLASNENQITKAVDLLALWPYLDASSRRGSHLSQVQIGEVGHSQAMKPSRVLRSYTLKIEANPGKAEQARYACYWYRYGVLDYCAKYYAQGSIDKRQAESTAGLGWIANQAQQRARGIINAGFAAEKATGEPFHCPSDFPLLCDATIQAAKGTTYTYWVKPPTCGWLPTQTHKALKNALRRGGKLRPTCEVRQGKNGGLVARVFVEFPKAKPALSPDVLACDVGVNIGVARSDGYKSKSLRPVMNTARERNRARSKQKHFKKSSRTAVKQLLDREARKAVTLAARTGKNLVIEACKSIGNLKPSGSIGGWPRQHFAARCLQISEEVGTFVFEQWPARSSITCPACDHCDKTNRRGEAFACVQCGFTGHADVIAAQNLARWARGKISVILRRPRKKHDSLHCSTVPSSGGVEKS